MKKAVLHLGFHKTGTTFLQLATKRWIELRTNDNTRIFFSSQHMPTSGWRRLRGESCRRLRSHIALASLDTAPNDYEFVRQQIIKTDLSAEFDALRRFFAKDEQILIHSDENSIGGAVGHPGYGSRRRLWPFYPNAHWLCAIFAAAAIESYDEVHIVLTIRRFDELVLSSFKDVAQSSRPVPAIDLFRNAVFDAGARCRAICELTANLPFVKTVHVLDYQLLQRSPADYFATFRRLASSEPFVDPVSYELVNPSLNDSQILDRLVKKEAIPPNERIRLNDLSALLGPDMLASLGKQYCALKHWLALSSTGDKLRYYG